jgi:hypothetical protein
MKRHFVLFTPGLLLQGLILILFLGLPAVAFAQEPGPVPDAGADAGEPVMPCDSAGNAILPSGQHGPPEPGAVPCEPQESEAVPDEEKEEEAVVEASADEVFTPGDEIHEDYPVPLPADM